MDEWKKRGEFSVFIFTGENDGRPIVFGFEYLQPGRMVEDGTFRMRSDERTPARIAVVVEVYDAESIRMGPGRGWQRKLGRAVLNAPFAATSTLDGALKDGLRSTLLAVGGRDASGSDG